MSDKQPTIYHNPRCSKSRQTLQLLEVEGVAPNIVEYLKTPPNAEELEQIINQLGIEPRDLLRTGESEYLESGLDNMELSREAVIATMVKYPKLIERPIVICNGKAAIGRPPEKVLEILP